MGRQVREGQTDRGKQGLETDRERFQNSLLGARVWQDWTLVFQHRRVRAPLSFTPVLCPLPLNRADKDRTSSLCQDPQKAPEVCLGSFAWGEVGLYPQTLGGFCRQHWEMSKLVWGAGIVFIVVCLTLFRVGVKSLRLGSGFSFLNTEAGPGVSLG